MDNNSVRHKRLAQFLSHLSFKQECFHMTPDSNVNSNFSEEVYKHRLFLCNVALPMSKRNNMLALLKHLFWKEQDKLP